jgi:hypothetical protein
VEGSVHPKLKLHEWRQLETPNAKLSVIMCDIYRWVLVLCKNLVTESNVPISSVP